VSPYPSMEARLLVGAASGSTFPNFHSRTAAKILAANRCQYRRQPSSAASNASLIQHILNR
jgi:hypothetical protein